VANGPVPPADTAVLVPWYAPVLPSKQYVPPVI
jgi:hypothetical protein